MEVFYSNEVDLTDEEYELLKKKEGYDLPRGTDLEKSLFEKLDNGKDQDERGECMENISIEK